MEICCENCKDGPDGDACRFSINQGNSINTCLGKPGKFQHCRGIYDNYYNHFTPKEEKVAATNTWTEPPTLKEVEYKHTGKELTAREVVYYSYSSIRETINLCDWVRKHGVHKEGNYLNDNLFSSNNFLEHALKYNCFRDFLVDGGYIEAVEKWVSPKMGDRFKHGSANEEYTLNSWGDYLVGLNNNTGGRQHGSDPVKVNSVHNITKQEFQQICGSIPVDKLEKL